MRDMKNIRSIRKIIRIRSIRYTRNMGKIWLCWAGVSLMSLAILCSCSRIRTVEDELRKALLEDEIWIASVTSGDTAYVFVSTTGDKVYGDRFLVLNQEENGSWRRSYENDFSGLKPWKLMLSDVDGDGEKDLVAAVRKTTYYDEEEKNRLFIFDYKEGKLVKKWTGSDIAGNWEDFITGDLVDADGEELLFISNTKEGKDRLLVYHWFDFGFLMLAQSEDYEDIIQVKIIEENRLSMTYRKEKEYEKMFRLKNGFVVEVKD
jgi:hypothetical protein